MAKKKAAKPKKYYTAGTVNDFGYQRWVVIRRTPYLQIASCRLREHADMIARSLNRGSR